MGGSPGPKCPLSRSLLGVKRTSIVAAQMSASDPKRTRLLHLQDVCFRTSKDHLRLARNKCHSFGTPLRACIPPSSKTSPEPATRSRTVCETRTSPGPASPPTRAPICTAIPARSLPTISHSPVCTPQRTSSPSGCTASRIAPAQRTARAGPSKAARKPSPVVLISRPRCCCSTSQTLRWNVPSNSRHRPSPSFATRSVEPTISANSTVASIRSGSRAWSPPVRNCSM